MKEKWVDSVHYIFRFNSERRILMLTDNGSGVHPLCAVQRSCGGVETRVQLAVGKVYQFRIVNSKDVKFVNKSK